MSSIKNKKIPYKDFEFKKVPYSHLAYLNRKFAIFLVYHLQGLPLSSIFITLLSLFCVIFASFSLLFHNKFMFAFLIAFSHTLDHADGVWAQAKKEMSDFGSFWDKYSDSIKEYIVDISLFLFYLNSHILVLLNNISAVVFLFSSYLALKSLFYLINDQKLVTQIYQKRRGLLTYTPEEKYLIFIPLSVFSFKIYIAHFAFLFVLYLIFILILLYKRYSTYKNFK